jgi:hypothetical protein
VLNRQNAVVAPAAASRLSDAGIGRFLRKRRPNDSAGIKSFCQNDRGMNRAAAVGPS